MSRKKIEREIKENPDAALCEWRSGLFSAIEIIKEYCGLEDKE